MENMTSVAAMLTKEQIKYLEDVSREMKRTGGTKLPRSDIVRNMIRILEKLDVDLSGVKDENELVERLLESAERYEG